MFSPAASIAAVRDRLGYGGGIATFYACLFVNYGVAMPYFYPWLASRGATVAEIATIASAGPLVRILVGPSVGVLADRSGAHRTWLVGLASASLLAWIFISQASAFWGFLLGMILISATGAPLMPLGETLLVAGVRRRGIDYGRVRLWGSVSFMIANLVAGWLVDWRGLDIVIVVLLMAAVATAASTMLLPTQPAVDGADAKAPPTARAALGLLRAPAFLLFLLAAGCAQSAHMTLNVFSTLHWQSLGISNAWCGFLWAIAVLAEIAVFWAAPLFARRIGALHLLAAGLAAGVFRWTLMGFDPPLALLLPLQVLHGLTYGAAHLGAIQFMARAVPPAQAGTGQSLYALVTGGLGAALATQAAGVAYLAHAGRAYWLMTALAVLGLLALWQLSRHWHGGEIVVSGTAPG